MELSQSRIASRRLLYCDSHGNPDSARPETALDLGPAKVLAAGTVAIPGDGRGSATCDHINPGSTTAPGYLPSHDGEGRSAPYLAGHGDPATPSQGVFA